MNLRRLGVCVSLVVATSACEGIISPVHQPRVHALQIGALFKSTDIQIAFTTDHTVFTSTFLPFGTPTAKLLAAQREVQLFDLVERNRILGTFFKANGYAFGSFDQTRTLATNDSGTIDLARYTALNGGSTLGIERHEGDPRDRFHLVLWDTDNRWKTLLQYAMPVELTPTTFLAGARWDQWAVLGTNAKGQTELLYKDGSVDDIHYGQYHTRGEALGLWMSKEFRQSAQMPPNIRWVQRTENNAIARFYIDTDRQSQSQDLNWPTDAQCISVAWTATGEPEGLLMRTQADGSRIAEYWKDNQRVSQFTTQAPWETTCALFIGNDGRRLAAWSEGDWIRVVDLATSRDAGFVSIPRDAE